jgi:hypothetical protein
LATENIFNPYTLTKMKRFFMIAAFAASMVLSADFASAQTKVEDYPTV